MKKKIIKKCNNTSRAPNKYLTTKSIITKNNAQNRIDIILLHGYPLSNQFYSYQFEDLINLVAPIFKMYLQQQKE